MIQGGGDWEDDDGPGVQMDPESATRERYRQQIASIVQNPTAPPNADVWQRNGSIEDSLVGLGSATLPVLQSEALARSGMELDALQVAAFRLQNEPLRSAANAHRLG